MRAEGVLRLILNIKLFKGMGLYLEQDKFLRIVALEEGKTVTFAIKVSAQQPLVEIWLMSFRSEMRHLQANFTKQSKMLSLQNS